MPRIAETQAPLRHFGDARSRSVWQWQLMLAVTTVAVAGITALLAPETFGEASFVIALALLVAVTLLTLGAPWHRADATLILLVPLTDILVIALLDAGAVAPLSYLWVFPIAWIATYYRVGTMIGALCLVGALMIVKLFTEGPDMQEAMDLIVQFITVVFIATIMSVGGIRNRSSKRLLRAQSARIGNALERVTDQQARNRRLLDSLDVGIARVGREGVLEVANDAFQRLYALDESTQFRHAHAAEYTARRGEPVPWRETTINRAARGELFADRVVWLFGIDGQWRALSATTRVIESPTSNAADDGLLLVVRDVTESLDPQARHGATMRSISHELRNPLTAVLGHVDLVLDHEDLKPEARHQLEVVERAAERMQTLIDNALAGDGPHTDDAEMAFDLAETAAASVEAFTPTANSEGIVLDVDLAVPLPSAGDGFRVRQVIDNVLSNAIKYSQRGGRVTIRGIRTADGDTALDVADTGIGISEEDLPRIFEPDFRTALARQSGVPGTGLGLGISRDILTAHGGRMLVNSALGSGTTITIVLPSQPEGHST